jgi:SET domain-containing protein
MPYYKKVKLKYLDNSKYGPKHRGLFAVEKIAKDEHLVYEDDKVNEEWPFYPEDDKRGKYTKSELLKLIKDYPQLEKLLYYHTYPVDDDLFNAPLKYANESFDNIDECEHRLHHGLRINHSCDPNVASSNEKGYALRDIEVGEEILWDYCCLVDATCLMSDIKCECGSSNCRKFIATNAYEDSQWREKNRNCCGSYILKKIKQLSEKENI